MLAAAERADELVFLETRACPLRCGATVLGKEYKEHVENRCPLRLVECPDGCGDQVRGADLEEHRTECPMGILLERVDVALRESAFVELRAAIAGMYREREFARTRMEARGKRMPFKGWPNPKCASRIAKSEQACRELGIKLKRKSKERLIAALAQGDADPEATEEGAVNAFKYWDTFDSCVALQATARGARPWDIAAPAMDPLFDVLLEAANCSADEKLRRRGETLLLGMLRRLLEAALATKDQAIMSETLQRVSKALQVVELQDVTDITLLMQDTREEMHRAALREVEDTLPEFHEAVAEGDVEICRWLFERQKASPDAADPRTGLTPLIVATKAGDLPMLELLLDQHADVNARCVADGLSALHWAALQRNARAMSVLLKGKANPRLQDRRGQDSLMKLVRRDVDKPAAGCDWSWKEQSGWRALPGPELPGSGSMDLESAKSLAESEPSCVGFRFAVGATSGRGRCAMASLRAAPSGNLAMPEESPEQGDDHVWISYLKVTAEASHDVWELIGEGADVMAQDAKGLTALHHHLLSAPSGGSIAVVRTILRASADVNTRDESGRCPLLLAVSSKRADIVRLMLREAFPPADVDAQAADGTSALALAESLGAREVAELLRSAGASQWQCAEIRLGARTTLTSDSRSLRATSFH